MDWNTQAMLQFVKGTVLLLGHLFL
uniref:Uncharacterized protein n=1 Tax=Arundo donax TaxID=35708 RepID=A0A0A9HSU4_ARUDO